MLIAVAAAFILQQTPPQDPPGQIVWNETPADTVAPPAVPPPPIPDWARADPYGYERSECSPMIRSADETLEQCQVRVRFALSANLGAALPDGLKAADAPEACRQEAAGDRYALQCGAPTRADQPLNRIVEQACETRPQATPGGGVTWRETCRPADGSPPAEEGLRFRIGGDDD